MDVSMEIIGTRRQAALNLLVSEGYLDWSLESMDVPSLVSYFPTRWT